MPIWRPRASRYRRPRNRLYMSGLQGIGLGPIRIREAWGRVDECFKIRQSVSIIETSRAGNSLQESGSRWPSGSSAPGSTGPAAFSGLSEERSR